MSIALMSAVWPMKIHSTQKFVLLSLADQANDEGVCWPSLGRLAQRTGLSERTVQYALQKLEKSGHIAVEKRHGRSAIFTIKTPADSAPPQILRPPKTPADSAPHPRRFCVTPPQILHP